MNRLFFSRSIGRGSLLALRVLSIFGLLGGAVGANANPRVAAGGGKAFEDFHLSWSHRAHLRSYSSPADFAAPRLVATSADERMPNNTELTALWLNGNLIASAIRLDPFASA